jgi:hypothetical protein
MTELSIVGRWSEHRDRLLETYKLTWLEDDDEPPRSPVTLKGNRKGQARRTRARSSRPRRRRRPR